MKPIKVGILHPGKMGSSMGIACQRNGHEVLVALDGRSSATKQRASDLSFRDVGSIKRLSKECDVIVSICMGAGVFPNAEQTVASGFKGIYIDANFIGVIEQEECLSAMLYKAGIDYVEASIYGWPYPHENEERNERTLYLTGKSFAEVSSLFSGDIFSVVECNSGFSAKNVKRKREEMDRENLMPHTNHGGGVIEFHNVLDIDSSFIQEWLSRRREVEPSDYTIDSEGNYINRGGYKFTPYQIKGAPERFLNLTPDGCPQEDIDFHQRLERAMFDCINCYANIIPVVKDCLWWRTDSHVAVYGPGAGMGMHHDTAIGGGADNENPLYNVVSGSLILEDDCQGGALAFLFTDSKVKPTAGSAVFYPSGYMGAHAVEAVTLGRRISYLEFFGHGKRPGQTRKL